MREIEFRKFDKVLKTMQGCTNSLADMFTIRNDGQISGNSDCILMQYTGLKDKNGVKIFEGDIMAFSKDGNKSFNYEVIYGGISFKLSGESYTHTERKSFEERIVIGNKFENPELLEIK